MKSVFRSMLPDRSKLPICSTGIKRSASSLGVRNGTAAVIAAVGLLGGFSLGNPFFLGLILFFAVAFDFQKRLDDGLPLVQITGLLAVLQWVVGPILAYYTDNDYGRYYMRVNEEEYFAYVLPGTCAFLMGMYALGSRVNQRQLLRRIPSDRSLTLGLILNALALAAEVAGRLSPGSLAFVFFLLAQLRYVGVLYLLRWASPWKWPLIAVFLSPLLLGTAASAMFHDMLIWLGLIFCYWYALKRRSVYQKWGLLALAAFGAFTIQGIKQNYRAKVWHGEEASLVEEAQAFWSSRENVTAEETLGNVISRLNQGWIIAAVMDHVPEGEPYAKGETIVEAARAALLPRFLDPDKTGAGGQKNFRRFTGLPLGESTSMAISPLGEAYANFGRFGSMLTILVYGGLFGLAVTWCFRFAEKYPDFLFWIPLIFYQSIKAESEFATVLNQITKGGLLAFSCYWIIRRWLLPFLQTRETRKGRRRTVRRPF